MGCDEVIGSSGLFEKFLGLSTYESLPSPWVSLMNAVGAPKFSAGGGVGFRVQRMSGLSYSKLERECFFDWAEGYAANSLQSDRFNPTKVYNSFEYQYYDVSDSYIALDNDNGGQKQTLDSVNQAIEIEHSPDVRVIYVDAKASSDLIDVGSVADWLLTSRCKL